MADTDQYNPEMFLGCLPRSTRLGDGTFIVGDESVLTIIPRDKLETMSMRPLIRNRVNQGMQNSCASAATAGCVMLKRHDIGLADVVLSQASLYRFVNGGRDSGSQLDDNLRQLAKVGIAPVSVVPQYNWQANPPWPTTWVAEAAKYKALEWWDLADTMAIASAVSVGMPCVIGVFWSGGGGHAIVCIGIRVKADGSLEFEILNSWANWGDGQCGFLP